MAKGQVRVDKISDNSGEILIAGDSIYKGYTSEQVSALITQITATFQPKPFDGRCPYKGLDVFDEEDAGLFFGRERLVDELVGRVKVSRTVFITGPSGSGKSSLARAGLMHALKQGAIKDLHSENWLFETIKPGRDPLGELARAVASLAGNLTAGDDIRTKGPADKTVLARWCDIALREGRDRRAVLFIDQFEEVFTQVKREVDRLAFLDLLTYAATNGKGRIIVLFSMRSDFVPNCATYPQLNALLNQQFIQIGAMQPEELVSAITQPALRVGLHIEPDLVSQIINDMQGEPGTLPLMQFALKDLFEAEQAQGGLIALTLNVYLQRGGIHKSLERHADDSFARLDRNEQELARSIFGGLIEIGRGTQDTRRTAIFEELIPADVKAEEVKEIVEKLADARLLTTDEQGGRDTVTLAHEKLIEAWPWLKKLVNENRDGIALQNEIASDAKEWDEHRRNASYLYTGARLINAREQLDARNIVLSGTSREFVKAGRGRQQRAQLATIAGISAIIALLILAVIVFSRQSKANAQLANQNEFIANTAQAASTLASGNAATAQANADEAQHQAIIARAGELAAQSRSMQDKNILLSWLLGIEAYKTFNTAQTRGLLLDNVVSHPQLLQFFIKHTDSLSSVAISPDGEILATGSYDHSITLWNVRNGQPIGQPLIGHTDSVTSVAFSPTEGGKILASASDDSTIILWDVENGQPIGQPLIGHDSRVSSLAFSPDGETLASGSDDKTIIFWNVATGQRIGQSLTGHTEAVTSLAFSPLVGSKMLASGSYDKSVILWNMETGRPIGKPLTGHTGAVYSVAFSPDGKTLASGGVDKVIILWNVATGQRIGLPFIGHTDFISSLAFSPDGKTLASGSYDHTIILWHVATHQRISQPFTGHSNQITDVAFSPDGKTLISGSEDNTIIFWNVAILQPIGQPLIGHIDSVSSVTFSPDGKMLASGGGNIILWKIATRRPLGQPFAGFTSYVQRLAISSDGKTLASSSSDQKTILLWDLAVDPPIGQPLTGPDFPMYSVAFSPLEGVKLLAYGSGNAIILWDVATDKPIGQPLTGHTDYVSNLAFSPDGKMLASASGNTIILWNVATGERIDQSPTRYADDVSSLAFSPNDRTLAYGSGDTIILWDIATGKPIGQPLTGHTDRITSVAFSPDGKTLASGSSDQTIILWDMATRQPIGQPLTGHTFYVYSVAFSPDGKLLASGSGDKTIILWDLDPKSWIEKTCQRVGRNLTIAEWGKYFPDEAYRATCSQWPLEALHTATPSLTP